MDRFWDKVDKSEECWIWTSNVHRQGYGFFKLNGKNMLAHRVAYGLTTGTFLEPHIKLLHTCDNTSCVRPTHLVPGTQKDNVTDMAQKGRHRGTSKLTDEQVIAIRNDDRTQRDIERDLGLARGTVSRIKHGKRYCRVAELEEVSLTTSLGYLFESINT